MKYQIWFAIFVNYPKIIKSSCKYRKCWVFKVLCMILNNCICKYFGHCWRFEVIIMAARSMTPARTSLSSQNRMRDYSSLSQNRIDTPSTMSHDVEKTLQVWQMTPEVTTYSMGGENNTFIRSGRNEFYFDITISAFTNNRYWNPANFFANA